MQSEFCAIVNAYQGGDDDDNGNAEGDVQKEEEMLAVKMGKQSVVTPLSILSLRAEW